MNPYMINPNQKLDDTYRSGLILIIIGCSFAILTLLLAIPAIITLVFAIKSLKYQTYRYKIVCGVMGLIFGFLLGIIGGILLLISDKTDQDDVIIIKQKDLK
ncbi:hypothetical protein MFERI13461_00422 [Mycoplasma feriruminatoris]|uniref:hypothetical protein n=1 Tax=Mycoplasma feriruminatoris TaxID=1179777 RepID=UPI0002A51EE6|nr:hypothetical protein [Mycoplasma feriruminatoris]UKS54108.1 putative membrane protein [Mycoplasma feriruminatoris]WFQ90989.1 hypothetical protein MFERI13461_00422 [Mycoplasma feriruminatoris]VZK65274.1 hypothetical protein MF5292_00447 [Mycoplasma feriruminatoris]VZR75422.1 hypothetical protein MF5294_00450 [Mycoplasma feriruminatoris]VZR97696.1 hypothetical protein MF5293_00449 [Mycoplasma feriruminatoris]